MSEYIGYRDGGKTDERGLKEELLQLFTPGFPTINNATGLKATQRGAGANMSVDIAVGDVHINRLTSDYSYWGWTDAIVNKTVTASDPTNPRKDIVVVYVDLAVVSSGSNNNPAALKFAVVPGTPAGSPVDPIDATIQTAVGASNPWKKICRIDIAASAPTVVNANITDLRTTIAFKGKLYGGSANTVGHTVPNIADDTVALLNATQTLIGKTLTAPIITDPVISGFNAPQGFLLNGQITRTVSSNNITVAIKTLSGSDPSGSSPVYVRIGNTIRTISAALSVTKNAGTNWFASGGAAFATLEVDYFVYLGYNATDGVTLGFARVPYARVYGDFSATTTNETYAAISTITNAVSTDEYEVVGRFNAILSATASFNWSVPGTSIIVNRPIFVTRQLSYVPQYTNITTTTATNTGTYTITNRAIVANINFVMGASSAMGSNPTITLPLASAAHYGTDARTINGYGVVLDSGTATFGLTIENGASTTTTALRAHRITASNVELVGFSSTIPMTWTTSDAFDVRLEYDLL